MLSCLNRSNPLWTLEVDVLLAQPFSVESLVKIHLPNDCILSGLFGPCEKIKDVVSFAKEQSLGDHYIFTRPPVVYMNKHLDSTLEQMNAVPEGEFHLGSVEDLWELNEQARSRFRQFIGDQPQQ